MNPPLPSSNLCIQAWTHREEILYPALFGRERQGVFTIQAGMFTDLFGQPDCDPAWLRCGVFEFAPNPRRASWLYVTSGMANAWNVTEAPAADAVSGLGCEFVLELPFHAPWAVTRLQYLMAYQLLVCHGRYPDRQPIKDYDQIPLGAAIGSEPSALTWVLFAPPTGFERQHRTVTGQFVFAQAVGISESEAKAGRIHGGELLVKGLVQEGAFPVTIPERKAIV